jgi:glycosyltransferase involved in cell wall biosynthesis
MVKKPLVSILIASFNKEKYVKRCIESCLKQSYKKIEIIFYDDASKDNSLKIAKKYKNIKILSNKKNKGFYKFNTYPQINSYCEAFKKSKGEIITFLDGDDFYKRTKVAKIVEYFTKKKKSTIVFDKPIFFYVNKKISEPFKESNTPFKKNIWPIFPPQSCISIKRSFFNKYIDDIKNKSFSMLTLDFRLAVLANTVLEDFFIIDKNLTYYFQDNYGESSTKFKKFGINWWARRNQAHFYMRYIARKYNITYSVNLDFIITRFIVSFFR